MVRNLYISKNCVNNILAKNSLNIADLSKITSFQVNSILSFVLASIFVTLICWGERFLNYYYHKKSKYDRNQKRFRSIAVKTLSYGILTTLRLSYMLLIMSMNSQIFIIVV